MSFEAALVLFGCTALIHIVSGASTKEYKHLQKSLMVNYSTSVRPVLDQNRSVLVNTALYLSGIDEVDAVGQRLVTSAVLEVTWLDEFLRWDLNSTGIQTLHFKQKDIWTPDLVLKNGVKKIEQLGGDFYYLKVTSDGYVRWLPFQVFESKCDVDITYFPYDDQFCDIVIHSWSFIKQEVNVTLFENDSTPVDYYSYIKNSVWDIVSTNAYASPDSSEESEVTFSFWLRRKPLFYINNLIVPMALQGVISLMVFVIPADAGEKMSFAMTVFLSFVVFLSIISANLPTNSEKIPILGVYIIIQMTKGVVIIIISSFQVRVHHRKSERKVGMFYRKIIRFERFLRCTNCSSKCSKHKGQESESYLDRIDWNDVSSAVDFVSFWIMLIFEILVFTIIMVKIQERSV